MTKVGQFDLFGIPSAQGKLPECVSTTVMTDAVAEQIGQFIKKQAEGR
jgi:hypothetical protein